MNNCWSPFTCFLAPRVGFLNKALLFVLFSLPLNAMDLQNSVALTAGQHQEDESLLTLSLANRALVIRLVIFNCMERNDFEGVSHVIEKTKLHPGKFVIAFFDTGPVIGVHYLIIKNRKDLSICGFSYKFYKAAYEAGHKRLIRLIGDAQSLYQAYVFAGYYHDEKIAEAIQKETGYRDQELQYAQLKEATEKVAKHNATSSANPLTPLKKAGGLAELATNCDEFIVYQLSLHKRLVGEELARLRSTNTY